MCVSSPEKTGVNLLLWYLGPAALLLALTGGFLYVRSRKNAPEGPARSALSAEEEKRLSELMGE